MLDSLKTPLVLVGRILIAFMFMQAGYEKLTDLTGTAAYIASGGLPNSTALAGLTGVFGHPLPPLLDGAGRRADGHATIVHEEHGNCRRPAHDRGAGRRTCQLGCARIGLSHDPFEAKHDKSDVAMARSERG